MAKEKIVTLSTGIDVKIKVGSIPQLVLVRMFEGVKLPKPPKIKDKEAGTEYYDDTDKEYLAKVASINQKVVSGQINILLDACSLPNGLPDESEYDNWYDRLLSYYFITEDMSIREKERAFIQFIAIGSNPENDIKMLMEVIAGVTHDKVNDAVDSFPS